MRIAMNRFRINRGVEADVERLWRERESHLTGRLGDGHFCGPVLDLDNQAELIDSRLSTWIADIRPALPGSAQPGAEARIAWKSPQRDQPRPHLEPVPGFDAPPGLGCQGFGSDWRERGRGLPGGVRPARLMSAVCSSSVSGRQLPVKSRRPSSILP